MSIRTNPTKAVPTLLKRLGTVRKLVDLNDLESELINIKDLFSMVKKNEDELLDTLTVVDGYLRNSNIEKLMEEKKEICNRIRISTQKLLPADAIQSTKKESPPSRHMKLNMSEHMKRDFKVIYDNLVDVEKRCFLSLLFFNKNVAIEKRKIILWWIKMGFIEMKIEKTMMKYGDYVFDKLCLCGVILPHHIDQGRYIQDKFIINPWIHHESERPWFRHAQNQLFGFYSHIVTSCPHNHILNDECLALDQKTVKLSAGFGYKLLNCKAIFNVGASYLNLEPKWMATMKSLEVLQLGYWPQDSPSQHVEVESEEFLKQLINQKNLKCLSLRGISRIFELPQSIFKLEKLETLDLKACHNLEMLPNDIPPLKNLKHLDLSQCYLLDKMPNGIEKLTNLRVLKGFVRGNYRETNCQVSNLTKLKNLERLSIHIKSEDVIQRGEFESLKKLSEHEHLKISWGAFDAKDNNIQIGLAPNLKKLHLEGFPGETIPQWLMPNSSLREVSIIGGKL